MKEIKLYQLLFRVNDSNYHNRIKYSRTIYFTEEAALADWKTAWDEVKSCGDLLYDKSTQTIFVKYGCKDIFLRCLQDARGAESVL